MYNKEYFDINGLYEHIKDLNERLENLDIHGTILISGGAALMLHMKERNDKKSNDIDILLKDFNNDIIKDSPFNTRVQGMSFGYSSNIEDRIQKVEFPFELRNLEVLIPSLEDVVASKLCANRKKDIDDINNQKIADKLNWKQLDKIIYEEMKTDSLNERIWTEQKIAYEKYKEDFYWKWQEEERSR